jgi:large subunit ribosomal protein L20
MARVKRGVVAHRRHKKILSRAKGYYNARRKVFRVAKQAVTKALQYAYIGRKQKKRQFRALWIVRINAASRQYGLSYSRLMNGLKKANITVDRKVLADIAVHDIAAFGALAEKANAALGTSTSKPASAAVGAAQDDLVKIEGIGPKIATLLHAAGIHTFAALAQTSVDRLKGILHDAGSHFASHDPATWAQQSALAAAGKWDELKKLQDELNGGRAA